MSISKVDARAADLHRRAFVIDGHCDILVPVADQKMTLAQRVEVPDPVGWQAPAGLLSAEAQALGYPAHALHFGPMGQYDVPRFLEGGVTAQVCAIYIDDEHLDDSLRRGLQMVYQLHRATADDDRFQLITSVADLIQTKEEGRCGAILSLEGFEALGADLNLLEIYHKLGLRMASLTHCRRNLFADGPQGEGVQTGGLTRRGQQAIDRMNALGIVIDLVHINDLGLWEILDRTTAPVVLSHTSSSNFPATDPHRLSPIGRPRPQLIPERDREILEAIAAGGGVVGIIWLCKEDVNDVVADIELAIELMGPDHVGLGSDLYGIGLAPEGLEDISKTPAITRALVSRGHSDEVVLKVLGGNYLRVFEQVWGR